MADSNQTEVRVVKVSEEEALAELMKRVDFVPAEAVNMCIDDHFKEEFGVTRAEITAELNKREPNAPKPAGDYVPNEQELILCHSFKVDPKVYAKFAVLEDDEEVQEAFCKEHGVELEFLEEIKGLTRAMAKHPGMSAQLNALKPHVVTGLHDHPVAMAVGYEKTCKLCSKVDFQEAYGCEECDFVACLECYDTKAKDQCEDAMNRAADVICKEIGLDPKVLTEYLKCHTDEKRAAMAQEHNVDFEALRRRIGDQVKDNPAVWGHIAAAEDVMRQAREHYDWDRQLTLPIHPHPLTFNDGLKNAFYCNVCENNITAAYRCMGCDFDCCLQCVEKNTPAPVAVTTA